MLIIIRIERTYMVVSGKFQNGVVVLKGDYTPPEGTDVEVVVPDSEESDPSFWNDLLKLAGTVDGPSDASKNLDHYLYGLPKRP